MSSFPTVSVAKVNDELVCLFVCPVVVYDTPVKCILLTQPFLDNFIDVAKAFHLKRLFVWVKDKQKKKEKKSNKINEFSKL